MSLRRLRYWWRTNPEAAVPIMVFMIAVGAGLICCIFLLNEH